MIDTKTINRLTISRHNFEKCLHFLGVLHAQEDRTIYDEALLLSAIIFYARPFSCNEKGTDSPAAIRIDLTVLNNLTEEERALHTRILELRNKAVTHAEWQFHPTGVTESGVIQSMPFVIWNDVPCIRRPPPLLAEDAEDSGWRRNPKPQNRTTALTMPPPPHDWQVNVNVWR